MSITDELRQYTKHYSVAGSKKDTMLSSIADRIDAEHESKVSYWQGASYKDGYDEGFASADDWLAQHEDAMAEHGWVKLPVDADGEYIHVGDEVDFLGHSTVDAIGKDGEVFIFASNWPDGVYAERACDLRHYHAPTVEDVLDEFANRLYEKSAYFDEEHVQKAIAEYAVKLRLAGDGE